MSAPGIKTAIPRHRYRIGAHEAVLLGDVESDDDAQYRYILAVVVHGQKEPTWFATAEPRSRAYRGPHALRLYTEDRGCEEIDVSREWADAEAFTQRALELACQRLGVDDPPQQLM
jgi:hypothetical protein